jgi:hypothetical protein
MSNLLLVVYTNYDRFCGFVKVIFTGAYGYFLATRPCGQGLNCGVVIQKLSIPCQFFRGQITHQRPQRACLFSYLLATSFEDGNWTRIAAENAERTWEKPVFGSNPKKTGVLRENPCSSASK